MSKSAVRLASIAIALLAALYALRTLACAPEPAALAVSERSERAPPAVDARLAAAPLESERAPTESVPTSAEPSAALAPSAPSAPAEQAQPAQALRLHGRAYDRHGAPVAGVPIADVQQPELELARSEHDGRFELLAPRAAESGELARLATVRGSPWVALRHPIARNAESELELVLVVAPAVQVEGVALLPNGAPATRATLQLEAGPHALPGFPYPLDRTERDHSNFPVNELGAFGPLSLPVGAVLSASNAGCEPARWTVPDRDVLDLQLMLQPARGPLEWVIEGVVVHADGTPAAFAQVHFDDTSEKADRLGAFRWASGVQPARGVSLIATSAGVQPACMEQCSDALLAKPGEPLFVKLELGPPTLSIRGRILTADDRPCADWRVQLASGTVLIEGRFPMSLAEHFGATERGEAHVRTGPDGRFELRGLSPRDYDLLAFDEKTLLALRREAVPAGSDGLVLRLAPDALHERVRGRVLDRRGVPVAQARVCATLITQRSTSGFTWESGPRVTTDEQGAFELPSFPREGCQLNVDGEDLIPESFATPEDFDTLELSVARRCHFQLELRPQRALPQGLMLELLDARGEALQIYSFQGFGWSSSSAQSVNERSTGVLSASQDASTLVLRAQNAELERLPIELVAGEVTRISW